MRMSPGTEVRAWGPTLLLAAELAEADPQGAHGGKPAGGFRQQGCQVGGGHGRQRALLSPVTRQRFG